MSRIHEALKKAEQERGAIQATEPVSQPLEATAAPTPMPAAFPINVETTSPATTGSLLSSEFLRFDDLRTHCAHPEWVLDPNVNVFFNPGLSPHATRDPGLGSRLRENDTGGCVRTITCGLRCAKETNRAFAARSFNAIPAIGRRRKSCSSQGIM